MRTHILGTNRVGRVRSWRSFPGVGTIQVSRKGVAYALTLPCEAEADKLCNVIVTSPHASALAVLHLSTAPRGRFQHQGQIQGEISASGP
eukprot:745043-Rhodomonas_salina.2